MYLVSTYAGYTIRNFAQRLLVWLKAVLTGANWRVFPSILCLFATMVGYAA